MEKLLKKFITRVTPRETRELVQDHVKKLEWAEDLEQATLLVDKRYAFHVINSHGHIERVIAGVKKTFGRQAGTVVQFDKRAANRDREKAVPHAVRYQ